MNFDLNETLDAVKEGVQDLAETAHKKTNLFHENYLSKIIPDCGKYGDTAKFFAEIIPGVSEYNAIKDGDWVVAIGANEKRDNGYMSYKARFLNRGTPPDGFVPEKRPSKPVPKFYHTVFGF